MVSQLRLPQLLSTLRQELFANAPERGRMHVSLRILPAYPARRKIQGRRLKQRKEIAFLTTKVARMVDACFKNRGTKTQTLCSRSHERD